MNQVMYFKKLHTFSLRMFEHKKKDSYPSYKEVILDLQDLK